MRQCDSVALRKRGEKEKKKNLPSVESRVLFNFQGEIVTAKSRLLLLLLPLLLERRFGPLNWRPEKGPPKYDDDKSQ